MWYTGTCVHLHDIFPGQTDLDSLGALVKSRHSFFGCSCNRSNTQKRRLGVNIRIIDVMNQTRIILRNLTNKFNYNQTMLTTQYFREQDKQDITTFTYKYEYESPIKSFINTCLLWILLKTNTRFFSEKILGNQSLIISFWWTYYTVSMFHTRVQGICKRGCLFKLLSHQLSHTHTSLSFLGFVFDFYIIGSLSYRPRARISIPRRPPVTLLYCLGWNDSWMLSYVANFLGDLVSYFVFYQTSPTTTILNFVWRIWVQDLDLLVQFVT